MNKITTLSKFFKWLFQISFILLPIFLIIYWFYAPQPFISVGTTHLISHAYIPETLKIMHPLSTINKVLGFTISLIPTSIQLLILYALIQLFNSFEKGEIFSTINVNYIKRISYLFFIGQLIHPIHEALLTAAMTWHNPPGERIASITITQNNLGILLIALLIMLISWIIAEGYKISEEQRYTV